MADTAISGADEDISQATTPGASPTSTDNTNVPGELDTPIMPLGTESFDDFQSAVTNGATYPSGFSTTMAALTSGKDDATTSNATGVRSQLVKYAKQFLGTPYVWGGSAPGGFDCSGLVQYVAKKFGLSLPRVSYQQANYGTRTAIKSLQAGDLVAWDENSRNNGADHIAFYIGNGYVLEAPHTGADVRIRKLSKSELNSNSVWGVHLDYK